MQDQRRGTAFTLVELLVVIGIIAALISLLLPALNRARQQANAVQCGSNERQIFMGLEMYANDWQGWIPAPVVRGSVDIGSPTWNMHLHTYDPTGTGWVAPANYIQNEKVFICPSDGFFSDLNNPALDAGAKVRGSYALNSFMATIDQPAGQNKSATGPFWYKFNLGDSEGYYRLFSTRHSSEMYLVGDNSHFASGGFKPGYDFFRYAALPQDDPDFRHGHFDHINVLYHDGHVETIAKKDLVAFDFSSYSLPWFNR